MPRKAIGRVLTSDEAATLLERIGWPDPPQRAVPSADHFARFNTNSSVTPAGVRGFVNFNSSSVMDVTIRR